MRAAMHQLQMSVRAFHRILKLARTIADLAESEQIEIAHLAGAIQSARGGKCEHRQRNRHGPPQSESAPAVVLPRRQSPCGKSYMPRMFIEFEPLDSGAKRLLPRRILEKHVHYQCAGCDARQRDECDGDDGRNDHPAASLLRRMHACFSGF